MPEYFGGAPNAFQGGVEFGATQRRRRLYENALNTLIQQYGPEAADPAAAAAMQGVTQSAAEQPYRMTGLQRTGAARDAAVAKYGVIAGDPAAQAAATEQDKQNEAERLAAGRRAAAVLQSVKENHGDIGQAFDFIQQALPAIGIPPEHLATIRDELVKDPESVDEFVHLLQDPSGHKALSGGQAMRNDKTGKLEWVVPTESGFRTVTGYTPANAEAAAARVEQGGRRLIQSQEKLNLGWKNLAWDKVKEYLPARSKDVQLFEGEGGRVVADVVPGSPTERALQEKLDKSAAGDQKLTHAFESVTQHADVVTTAAQRALQYFSDADAGVLMQALRTGTKLIPGTKAYETNRALDEIRNNIGIDELQRMRANSPTGGALGNVSDRDMSLLTGALGQLEVARDPEVMRNNLNRIVENYSKIVELARQDAERAQYRATLREQSAGTHYGPPRSTPPAGAPKKPSATAEPSLDDLLNHYAPVPQ